MSLPRLALAALLAGAAAASAAAAAPAPAPLSPQDATRVTPSAGVVVFETQDQASEPAGTLTYIQVAGQDPLTDDATGLWYQESARDANVDDYDLHPIAAGSDVLRAVVPAWSLDQLDDRDLKWHPVRQVPNGSCPPGHDDNGADCYDAQTGATRTLTLHLPAGYADSEPNNGPLSAADVIFARNCGYLKSANDADWFKFSVSRRRFTLRLTVRNLAGQARPTPLGGPAQDDADMALRLYAARSQPPVLVRRVRPDQRRTISLHLRRGRTYRMTIVHAPNGHSTAVPATDLKYRFDVNLPDVDRPLSSCTG